MIGIVGRDLRCANFNLLTPSNQDDERLLALFVELGRHHMSIGDDVPTVSHDKTRAAQALLVAVWLPGASRCLRY